MKTKNENREEIRETSVTFSVTANEKEIIKKQAANKGLTMSTYIRQRLLFESRGG